jgi:hypothetical protein
VKGEALLKFDGKRFIEQWECYLKAKDLRIKAETNNSAEQQAYIEPLFQAAFPALAGRGIKYVDCWQCDGEQDDITAWEASAGIDAFCTKVAAKNSPVIQAFQKAEYDFQTETLNAILNLMETDARYKLTADEMLSFRSRINSKDGYEARKKLTDFVATFVDDIKKQIGGNQ